MALRVHAIPLLRHAPLRLRAERFLRPERIAQQKLFHGHVFFVRGLDLDHFDSALTRLDPKGRRTHGQDSPRPLPVAADRSATCLDAGFPDDQAILPSLRSAPLRILDFGCIPLGVIA